MIWNFLMLLVVSALGFERFGDQALVDSPDIL